MSRTAKRDSNNPLPRDICRQYGRRLEVLLHAGQIQRLGELCREAAAEWMTRQGCPPLETPIGELLEGVRGGHMAEEALRQAGVRAVGDISRFSDAQLLGLPGLGKHLLRELRSAYAEAARRQK